MQINISLSYFRPTLYLPLMFFLNGYVCTAQVISDHTTSSKVTFKDSSNFIIHEGQTIGQNLFHSFEEFSVPARGSVLFDNSPTVSNIITRVTGNRISHIDGVLRANYNANLFLLNPRGIHLGADARLELGGSFIATTAEKFLFDSGFEFKTFPPERTPLLTMKASIGLQFGHKPAEILVQSRSFTTPPMGLTVNSGKTIALIGGDVTLDTARIDAPSGRIELGSVNSLGVVGIENIDGSIKLNYIHAHDFGHISLINQPFLTTSGAPEGVIHFQGRNIDIADASIVLSAALLPTNHSNSTTIQLNATENINISGHSLIGAISSSLNQPGGDIILNAQNINLDTHASVSINSSESIAGDIIANSHNLTLQNNGTIFSDARGKEGGDIHINTTNLYILDNGIISAFPREAKGGDILINAKETVQIIGKDSRIAARAYMNNSGEIIIKAKNLSLALGGEITTSTFGSFNSGSLMIEVLETTLLSGEGTDGENATALTSRSTGNVIGDSGSINLKTGQLVIEGGGVITVGAQPERNPRSPQFGPSTANAGSVNIIATEAIQLSGSRIDENGEIQFSSITAETNGIGNSGDIKINSPKLIVKNGAEVTSRSRISGDSGSINISANQVLLDNNGKLIADTEASDGGNIDINAQGALILRSQSLISTTGGLLERNGDGGNINISAGLILAFHDENSDISTNSFSGSGGTINIMTQELFGLQFRSMPTQFSDITATSQIGLNGNVSLEIPESDPSDSLHSLLHALAIEKPWPRRCPQALSDRSSNFIVTRRGGIAIRPSRPLTSFSAFNQLAFPVKSLPIHTKTSTQVSSSTFKNANMIEAQGWSRNSEGLVSLIATPANSSPLLSFHDHRKCGYS